MGKQFVKTRHGETLLSCILAEAVFSSLKAFGDALGERLLPSYNDIIELNH